jgi:hypothetical protein
MKFHKRSLNFSRGLKIRTRVEDEVVSDHTMKVRRGRRGIVLLNQNLGTTDLPLGRDPVTHWLEEWVGPKASLDDLEKRKTLLPLLELKRRILHPSTPIITLKRLLAEYS